MSHLYLELVMFNVMPDWTTLLCLLFYFLSDPLGWTQVLSLLSFSVLVGNVMLVSLDVGWCFLLQNCNKNRESLIVDQIKSSRVKFAQNKTNFSDDDEVYGFPVSRITLSPAHFLDPPVAINYRGKLFPGNFSKNCLISLFCPDIWSLQRNQRYYRLLLLISRT